MDFQDQQETEGVRLEGKARASFRMELQGQKDAEARVASGVCVGSVDSVAKWPELCEWLEWPDELEWPEGSEWLDERRHVLDAVEALLWKTGLCAMSLCFRST